jgi:endonuclease/exonuclease/phosphatase family metal-dependent hydrolase
MSGGLTRIGTLMLVCLVLILPSAWAQNAGDRVVLVERALGIPGHPSPGNNSVSFRFPGGITTNVLAVDSGTGWIEVRDDSGSAGWIIRSYISSVVPAGTSPSSTGSECYEVGTWNLEHFGKGKSRGFPENTSGGPTYPPRTSAQLTLLATAIRDVVKARILVLTEVNGRNEDDEDEASSEELDDLVGRLGQSFRYVIARTGNSQRIAVVYDGRFARLNAVEEIEMPNPKVQGKGLFDRQPLMAHFTFIQNGAERNDLVVVGLHLASGQHLTGNHDQAMRMVVQALTAARRAGRAIPAGEHDVLLVGDLNASWFDNKREEFFDEMDRGDWKVLAKDSSYPATRLAGAQLQPRSQIDYLIASRNVAGRRGLFGEEISAEQATVHHHLADGDWNNFRRVFSDHFPVTTCIAVIADND